MSRPGVGAGQGIGPEPAEVQVGDSALPVGPGQSVGAADSVDAADLADALQPGEAASGGIPGAAWVTPPPGPDAKASRRQGRLILRAIIAGLAAIVSALAAWWLLGRGIRTDDFPPFLDTQTVTPIVRYSGPWLTAAAGAALLAALLLMAAVFAVVRWSGGRSGVGGRPT